MSKRSFGRFLLICNAFVGLILGINSVSDLSTSQQACENTLTIAGDPLAALLAAVLCFAIVLISCLYLAETGRSKLAGSRIAMVVSISLLAYTIVVIFGIVHNMATCA